MARRRDRDDLRDPTDDDPRCWYLGTEYVRIDGTWIRT